MNRVYIVKNLLWVFIILPNYIIINIKNFLERWTYNEYIWIFLLVSEVSWGTFSLLWLYYPKISFWSFYRYTFSKIYWKEKCLMGFIWE